MTQCERIVEYLQNEGSITPVEAFTELGITKLATRIGELRAAGTVINGEWQQCKNRYGEIVRYMRYSLKS